MIKTNKIISKLLTRVMVTFLMNSIAIQGLAHAPEFHLQEKATSESAESITIQDKDSELKILKKMWIILRQKIIKMKSILYLNLKTLKS